MPFTPFHMGPGAAIKAITGRYFSLMVFGFSQVAIDIEPLIRILRNDNILHGFSHTYLGALLIGFVSMVVGKVVCNSLISLWNTSVNFRLLAWARINNYITWWAAASGAFIGTISHVALDSIMHSDMKPFSPFSASNHILHIIPTGWLHLLCIALGVLGITILFILWLWNKWSINIE